MKPLFVYLVCASREEAGKIARACVEGRLAACANIFPEHESVYSWKGKIEEGREVAMILKTRAELFESLKDKIVSLHSYEVPCVVALPIDQGNFAFLSWIEAETTNKVL